MLIIREIMIAVAYLSVVTAGILIFAPILVWIVVVTFACIMRGIAWIGRSILNRIPVQVTRKS